MAARKVKTTAISLSLLLFVGCATTLNTPSEEVLNPTKVSNISSEENTVSEGESLSFGIQRHRPPKKMNPCKKPPPIPKKVIKKIKINNPELLDEINALKGLSIEEHHAKMTELAAAFPQYFKAPPPLPPNLDCSKPQKQVKKAPPKKKKKVKCKKPPAIPQKVIKKIKKYNPELLDEINALKGLSLEEHHAKMTELAAAYPQYFKAPPPLPPACIVSDVSPEDGMAPPPPEGDMTEPPPPEGTEPPPPSGESCPLPPLPPPDIMELLKVEQPDLYNLLLEMQETYTFLDYHNKMVELSQQYPQYFAPPPPLSADGSCPPPPPDGDGIAPPPPEDDMTAPPPPEGTEPPPPSGETCPLPPLPPPDIMELLKVEEPDLYNLLLEMQETYTFLDYHNKMVELSQQYPQYFAPPPPLPPDGSCPPPPPPPPGG